MSYVSRPVLDSRELPDSGELVIDPVDRREVTSELEPLLKVRRHWHDAATPGFRDIRSAQMR